MVFRGEYENKILGYIVFLLIMLTAAGCERKSVEDIRSMEETKLVGESGSEVSDISFPMEKELRCLMAAIHYLIVWIPG